MDIKDKLISISSLTSQIKTVKLAFFNRSASRKLQLSSGLIDIFAAFVSLDNKLEQTEAEVALDLLRNAFPELNHVWLRKRLYRALSSPQKPEKIAKKYNHILDYETRVSLALKLYLLISASQSSYLGKEAFQKVMIATDSAEIAKAVLAEMEDQPYTKKLPFDKLVFSDLDDADVLLPSCKEPFAFRAYQAQNIIILRNTGKTPIWISGSSLAPGHIIRLRQHQNIHLPCWTLTTEDIAYFLNFSRTGQRQSIFLNESDEEQLSAERTRTRLSSVKLDFGLNVTVEALSENTQLLLSSGKKIKLGRKYTLSLQDHLLLKDGSEICLKSLRKQSLAKGNRFKIDAGRRECLVSNDPSEITRRGDVFLSPGLAPKVTLRIQFNPQTAEGIIKIIHSQKPITINDKTISSGDTITDGTLIRLSPNQALRCRLSEGLLDEERTVIRELCVEGLHHRFSKDKKVLDNVAFSITRGEMLCIMGPSGCGKSTLLSTLAGHLKPKRGKILLNGVPLYKHRSRLAPFIANMPQEEALNPQLTVREHLLHASTIRRPRLNTEEHNKRVNAILAELTLQPLASRQVGTPGDKKLSGGERGRLNLGLDLNSSAEIFLFDEPISGLSSKDSEHVAETLHALSRDKIVIASLHRPGAQVLRLFDKVLILDQGGKIAFFGTPQSMSQYFLNASKELAIAPPTRLQNQQEGADFVFDVLETPLHGISGRQGGGARRFSPSFWQSRFEGTQLVEEYFRGKLPPSSVLGEIPMSEDHMPVPSLMSKPNTQEWFRIFRTHFMRSFLSKFRNKGTLYSIFLEAPLLALLIGLTLRSSPEGQYNFHTALHIPVYLFLSVTIAMFLGLTNSATEILRDSPILRRERNTRSALPLYVLAKFLTLSILAAIQCGIYIAIGNWMLEIQGMFFIHWGWMTLTAICGTSIALFISSIVKTERAALSAVPLLLVPQLLLAGALVSFSEMNRGLFQGGEKGRNEGVEPFPSHFMPLRYAYEGIVVSQATRNPFEKFRRQLQNDIDPLKKRNDLRITGKISHGLTPKESERLDTLKTALTRLMASEAENVKSANDLCWKITHAGRKLNKDKLLSIPPYPEDENIKTQPCRHYFTNSRTELLVGKADLDRVDIHQAAHRSIFLAEWKYWLGFTTLTTHADLTVLGGFTFTLLSLTTLSLQRRKNKNN